VSFYLKYPKKDILTRKNLQDNGFNYWEEPENWLEKVLLIELN